MQSFKKSLGRLGDSAGWHTECDRRIKLYYICKKQPQWKG